jgi:hypothetical protein
MVLHRDAAAGRQRIDEQITPSSSNPSVAFGCSRARRVNVKATQLDGGAHRVSADSDNIPCYVLVHVYSGGFFNNTLA